MCCLSTLSASHLPSERHLLRCSCFIARSSLQCIDHPFVLCHHSVASALLPYRARSSSLYATLALCNPLLPIPPFSPATMPLPASVRAKQHTARSRNTPIVHTLQRAIQTQLFHSRPLRSMLSNAHLPDACLAWQSQSCSHGQLHPLSCIDGICCALVALCRAHVPNRDP